MKISVCMATYNGEKYIKKQLESITHQLKINDEIIISDDSSTDNTIEIIESMNDDRILIYKNNLFHSPIFNFENALKKSSGDYIFLCDQDDLWDKERVKKVIEIFNLGYDLIINDARIIDCNDTLIKESLFAINHSRSGILKNIIQNSYVGCCMSFNKKILNYSLPFPRKIPMHDSWIGIISEMSGKVYFLEDSLISYRRHGDNISQTGMKSKRSLIQQFSERVYLISNLSKRYYDIKIKL